MGRESKDLTPTITFLMPHHRSMARCMCGGATPGELATGFGFTPTQITKIINSPAYRTYLAHLEGGAEDSAIDVRADLKRMSERAVEVLDEQLNKPGIESKIQQKAAFGVLDRAGYGAKEGGKGSRHLHLTKIENVENMSTGAIREEMMDLIEEGDFEESG